MTYLFFFAHPDDETVACACTIKKLTEQGDRVIVVTATVGGAGEVHDRAQAALQKAGSVAELRKQELHNVSEFLGVSEVIILGHQDGQITNEVVWGKLMSDFVELIEVHKPDVVITFDHTGWYFHLDHVGVSIAATRAVQHAQYQPDAFLFSLFRPNPEKWQYIYAEKLPVTHYVDVAEHRDTKLQALDLHASQNLQFPKKLTQEENHQELYQLVQATPVVEKLLHNHPIFRSV
jgi:LmbE family N-acetylglucosaminyl deacetylase